jgi:Domain of unknown function (DUF4232)
MKTLLFAAAVLAATAGHAAAASTADCLAGPLKATFAVVPNSEGAGNIVYRLRLTNTSAHACSFASPPHLTLLGAGGRVLPTHVIAGRPGALATIHVTVAPHASVSATARFSPDVPGVGENNMGPCEAPAHWLRVGTKVKATVSPPTPVCEHGQLQLTKLTS